MGDRVVFFFLLSSAAVPAKRSSILDTENAKKDRLVLYDNYNLWTGVFLNKTNLPKVSFILIHQSPLSKI